MIRWPEGIFVLQLQMPFPLRNMTWEQVKMWYLLKDIKYLHFIQILSSFLIYVNNGDLSGWT